MHLLAFRVVITIVLLMFLVGLFLGSWRGKKGMENLRVIKTEDTTKSSLHWERYIIVAALFLAVFSVILSCVVFYGDRESELPDYVPPLWQPHSNGVGFE